MSQEAEDGSLDVLAEQILPNDHYTVAWICALGLEQTASCVVLDAIHEGEPDVVRGDENSYILGRIGSHNIVIATLPLGNMGNVMAATVVTQLTMSFPSIKFSFMVGIGGGVPSADNDVRLGDVVVGTPEGEFGGVVKWDFGKAQEGGFKWTGKLNKPPHHLLAAVNKLKSTRHDIHRSAIPGYISAIYSKHPHFAQSHAHRGQDSDTLFVSTYPHKDPTAKTCEGCDRGKLWVRTRRNNSSPVIHYGIIASGDQVIKDAIIRDGLSKRFNAKCCEMEAAGIMDRLPCLAVRGICDYSDSHKNKGWQNYAALVAAAYVKELLSMVRPERIPGIPSSPPVRNTPQLEIPGRGRIRSPSPHPSDVLYPTPTVVSAPPLSRTPNPQSNPQPTAEVFPAPLLTPPLETPPEIHNRGKSITENSLARAPEPPFGPGPLRKAGKKEHKTAIKTQPPPTADKRIPRYAITAVSWASSNYCVFFQTKDGVIHEAKLDKETEKWSHATLDVDAKSYTPLAAVAYRGGQEIRLYYVNSNDVLQEHRFTPSKQWIKGSLEVTVAPYSRIAAVGWMHKVRLYYQGTDRRIQEYRCASSKWTKGEAIFTAALPLEGSSLAAACYTGDDATYIHTFYQDKDLNLREIVYDGKTFGEGKFPPLMAPRYAPITSFGLYENSAEIAVYWKSNEGGDVLEYSAFPPQVGKTRTVTTQIIAADDIALGADITLAVVKLKALRKVLIFKGEENEIKEYWEGDNKTWTATKKVPYL